jgi:O-antigen ligase
MLQIVKLVPLPITLVIASFLFPTELSLMVADLRLPPHRIAILLAIPFAAWQLLSRPSLRIRAFDVLFLLYGTWTMIVYGLHGPDHGSFVYGGSIALESFGSFLIARAYIRDWDTFRATLKLLIGAAFVAMLFALPETFLGKHFTHDFLQTVTGHVHPREYITRLGLTRAYGVFDHPIHLGTFAATLLALIWFSGERLKYRLKACGVIALTTFAALSSAPILCALTQVGLIIWDRVTRGLKGRFYIAVGALIAGYVLLTFVANRSPVNLIATGLTLDSWTGFYRLQIWQHGLENVARHPWLGLGLGDWTRAYWMYSDSVDAYWLVVMMRTGIPAFVLLACAILLLVIGVLRMAPRARDRHVDNAAKAWLMAVFALSLIAATVHFWNVSHAYFFFILGLAGWIADPVPQRYRKPAVEREQRRPTASRHRGQRQRPSPAYPEPAVAGHGPYPVIRL